MSANLVGSLRGIVMRAPGICATRDFYTQNWGLTLAHEEPGAVWLRATGDQPFAYGLQDGPVYGIAYVDFDMTDRDQVARLHAHATAQGARVLGEPGPFDDWPGGWGFEILDPDHRRLRFRTQARRLPPAPDWARPRKVSHVVLNSPDMDGVQDWYCRVLGFRVSDYSADQMVFLRCASDHHSIALVRGHYASVNHVAFELPSIDEFMRSIGRMKEKGIVPTWGPGRHGPGNNPFAYYVSPSGFVIEFTSELQQIDEATHQAQVWPRDVPEAMDRWMTAGPPTAAQRAVMQGRPDPGWPELAAEGAR
jgi:catechol 2,3-dioxygenase-like lactoylglutathione lyase family enzyme